MSTLLWLLTEAGLVLCWLVTPWAPAPWLALCWLMAPLAGWLALLLTRKRSQVRLTCPVTAEKGKPFSVTAEVRQGVPFGRGRAHGIGGEHRYRRDAPGEADPASGPGSVAGAECLAAAVW